MSQVHSAISTLKLQLIGAVLRNESIPTSTRLRLIDNIHGAVSMRELESIKLLINEWRVES